MQESVPELLGLKVSVCVRSQGRGQEGAGGAAVIVPRGPNLSTSCLQSEQGHQTQTK